MENNKICSFKDCGTSTLNRKDCCFYEFPTDFNLCLQWVECVGNKDFFEDFAYGGAVPFRRKYICSLHFAEYDFNDRRNIFAGIKPTAIPCYVHAIPQGLDNGPSQNVSVKTEPPEKEFWDPVELARPVFPVDILEHVKVEEISSQSLNIEGIEPDNLLNFTKMKRSKRASAMARKRAQESPEERLERLRKNSERAAYRRSIESEEQSFLRKSQNARRTSLRRKLETPDEKERRKRMNAERQARKRETETPAEKEIRRMKDLLRARRRRLLETEEQRAARRMSDAARAHTRRQNETEEEKNIRRLTDLIRIANRRKNESQEQREDRLKKNREYSQKKRLIRKLEYDFSHPKSLLDDTAMSLRSCDESISSVHAHFLQSFAPYPKPLGFHIDSMFPSRVECDGNKHDKFMLDFESFNAPVYSELKTASQLDNSSSNETSEESVEQSSDEITDKAQLVLL